MESFIPPNNVGKWFECNEWAICIIIWAFWSAEGLGRQIRMSPNESYEPKFRLRLAQPFNQLQFVVLANPSSTKWVVNVMDINKFDQSIEFHNLLKWWLQVMDSYKNDCKSLQQVLQLNIK